MKNWSPTTETMVLREAAADMSEAQKARQGSSSKKIFIARRTRPEGSAAIWPEQPLRRAAQHAPILRALHQWRRATDCRRCLGYGARRYCELVRRLISFILRFLRISS